MTRRTWTLAGLAVIGLLALAAAGAERRGAFAPVEDLGDAPAAVLDTVRLDGRHVRASVGGVVLEADGHVVVVAAPSPFVVRLPEADSLVAGDLILAVGRLEERSDGRHVQAYEWTHVRPVAAAQRDSAREVAVRPELPTVGGRALSGRAAAP